MDHTRLGTTGLQVSRICLGMMSYGSPTWREWVLDLDASRPLVRDAVEAGITFFDTADMYSLGASEEVTGALLREFFPRRDDYVLATKVYMPMGEGPNDRGLSRKHVLASIDDSLRRLGTDHVDLYQIHRWDPRTPIEETMEALHDVVRAGKARYLGASSMWAWQFAKAQHTADLGGWTRFVSMQDHYNLLYREEEREMHPLCLDQGVGVIPWSPLARGRLTPPAGAGDDHARGQRPHRRPPVRRRGRRRRARAGRRGEGARAADGAGRAGVDARQGRRHRTDHRRDAGGARGRRRRGRRRRPVRRRGRRAGGRLRAAPGGRPRVTAARR
nr:aldo/keto reductase [uncultured bacterium]